MRVALVIERFEATGGGGEQVAWNVARELRRAGDEVHVLCRRGVDAPGICVTRLATPSFWQPLRVYAFAHRVRRALNQGDFDVTHSFSRTLGQDVFHAGGGCHADYMQKVYGRLGARMRRFSPRHRGLLALERSIFRDPKLITQCVSTMVQREIREHYDVPEARLPILYGAVDVERFAPERNRDARETLRAERSAGRATVWLFAGSGWRRKGLDTAIAALANVADPTTQLWVAGQDNPRRWRRLAEREGVAQRVHFVGERRDLERYYAAADGLLFPTRYDAFGLVCLEAAAAGLPVVTNRRAGAAELFETCGRVVPGSDDAIAYAEVMDDLACPNERARLGAMAREMARHHDWSGHVTKLRTLYLGIVRDAARSAGRSDKKVVERDLAKGTAP